MKHFTTIITAAIIAFWIAMNSALVWQQVQMNKQGRLARGVTSFLGSDLRRERWMSIYRRGERIYRKVGYTGLVLEKIYGDQDVEYHVTVETMLRGGLPLPLPFALPGENKSSVRVHGTLVLSRELKPQQMQLDVTLNFLEGSSFGGTRVFFIRGKRLKKAFLVEVLDDEEVLISVPVPLERFALTDGFSPALPVGDFQEGEEFRLQVFNPLGMAQSEATVEVVDEKTVEVQGELIDVFELRTEVHGRASTSLVTSSGEVIRSDFGPPLNVRLEYAKSREVARRGIEP